MPPISCQNRHRLRPRAVAPLARLRPPVVVLTTKLLLARRRRNQKPASSAAVQSDRGRVSELPRASQAIHRCLRHALLLANPCVGFAEQYLLCDGDKAAPAATHPTTRPAVPLHSTFPTSNSRRQSLSTPPMPLPWPAPPGWSLPPTQALTLKPTSLHKHSPY